MPAPTIDGHESHISGEERLYHAMRYFWHPVLYAAELKDKPEKVFLLDEQLAIMRIGGEVRAFADLCAHRGTAISLGRIEGKQVRCAYHGWTYDAEGVCTAIPARFGTNIPARARLQRYEAVEKGGLIWVCLESKAYHPIPVFPEFDAPGYRVVQMPAYDWDCNFARRVENFVDFAHHAWVHDGILGDRNSPEVPDHDVWREGAELRLKIGMAEPETNPTLDAIAGPARELYIPKNYRVYIPNAVWLQRVMVKDGLLVLFMSTCPVGPKRTRSFTFIARNYDLEADDQRFIDYNELIIGQDRPVTESQRPEELPVDLSAELHIKGVDRVSLEYRRWLIDIANRFGLQNANGA